MITRPYQIPPKRTVHGFFGPYGFLSNFHVEPDRSCVEVEYQRAKCAQFKDRALFDKLIDKGTITPMQAKAIGRKVTIRDDWEDVKVSIMIFYVTKKFKDHEDLRILLSLTADAHLEETNTWGDQFWGVCRGQGQNVLGDILMQVRSELGTL